MKHPYSYTLQPNKTDLLKENSIGENQVALKYDRNNRYFT
jgi:hypothetical protein